MDEESVLSPKDFFETLKLREEMHRLGKPARPGVLARAIGVDKSEVGQQLKLLVQTGLVEHRSFAGYALTDEGIASVRWSAPPPPDGAVRPRWVTELAIATAEHYGVTVAQLFREMVGPAVTGRSRLCYALWARGWALERIEEHFGLPPGWAGAAVERWKRFRGQAVPRTGAELRAWRRRLGLTQEEAAARLGVSRRTIIRAERSGELSPHTAFGRM